MYGNAELNRYCANIYGTIESLLCGYLERTNEEIYDKFRQNTFFQRLQHVPDDNDEQKVIHSDTFFPAIKYWYFPEDVMEADGPFHYVPYSVIIEDDNILKYH